MTPFNNPRSTFAHMVLSALVIAVLALAAAPLGAQTLTVPKREQVTASPLADAARRGDHQAVAADSLRRVTTARGR